MYKEHLHRVKKKGTFTLQCTTKLVHSSYIYLNATVCRETNDETFTNYEIILYIVQLFQPKSKLC